MSETEQTLGRVRREPRKPEAYRPRPRRVGLRARKPEEAGSAPGEEQTLRRAPGPAYWLIAKNTNGRVEALTVERGGEKTLPVFSFEEEAGMFLWLAGLEGGWRTRASGAGSLISLLYGPCAGVSEVALDPLPEMFLDGTARLLSLNRERFVEHLADASSPSRLCESVRIVAERDWRAERPSSTP